MIPGALEGQGAEGGSDGAGSASGVAGLDAAATDHRTRFVGVIGVEALRHRLARDPRRHLAGGGLHRLEVEAVERARVDQALDFGGDLRRDLGPEPPFCAVGARVSVLSRIWQIVSLTRISSLVRSRRRWHSPTCRRVSSTA